jgi:tRNA modification GTPase
MWGTADTIAAISTAAGSAARAVVRLSGPEALRLAEGVFVGRGEALAARGGFRAVDGRLRLSARGIELPARAYVFCAPRSYSRQDVAELHVPSAAADAALDALIDAGARRAEPGEFTARAFFSGRLDLSAAEAVADVIDAADDAQLRAAAAGVGGRIRRLCQRAAAQAADALATVEASIELAAEEIALEAPAELASRLGALGESLRPAAAEAADLPDPARQAHAVIAGRANVGKSSLLNALTGTDRAIVAAVAGTTRDVLSAPLRLGSAGVVVVQDAAGFAASDDPLAAAAHAAARRAVARADVVCFVADLAEPDPAADRRLLAEVRRLNPRAAVLLVGNKADAVAPGAEDAPLAELADAARLPPDAFAISCRTGLGLQRLCVALAEALHLRAARGGEALGLHRRQQRAFLAAAEALARAAGLLRPAGEVADVAELAAVEIRTALAELAGISGRTPEGAFYALTDDALGRIFARFCVGK